MEGSNGRRNSVECLFLKMHSQLINAKFLKFSSLWMLTANVPIMRASSAYRSCHQLPRASRSVRWRSYFVENSLKDFFVESLDHEGEIGRNPKFGASGIPPVSVFGLCAAAVISEIRR